MTSQTTVERLCTHHSIHGFDCPEENYLEALQRFYLDANVGILARTYVTVLDGRVTGYIAVSDAIIDDVRLFYRSHLAVSRDRRRSNDVIRLWRRSEQVKQALSAVEKKYYGDAVSPGDNDRLIRLAESAGFRRWRNTDMWIRFDNPQNWPGFSGETSL